MKYFTKAMLLMVLIAFSSCTEENLDLDTELNVSYENKNAKGESYCETAFAYYKNACFLDDEELNSNRWGWTIGPIEAPLKSSYPIYAGAGQCDLDKGTQIGDLYVLYLEDGTLNVYFRANDGYAFYETHLYYGKEKYPRKKNGKYTVAPGQYGNSNSYLKGTNLDTYSFKEVDGSIYIIAHAVVCEVEFEECKVDAGSLKPDAYKCLVKGDSLVISATPDGNAIVPDGFKVLYVLTTGENLTIIDVNDVPEFTVDETGDFRIHTLVYNPDELDLGGVEFGVTQASEVLKIIEANELCAALDVKGAYFGIKYCKESF